LGIQAGINHPLNTLSDRLPDFVLNFRSATVNEQLATMICFGMARALLRAPVLDSTFEILFAFERCSPLYLASPFGQERTGGAFVKLCPTSRL
jgi:hypothetical protein